MRSNDPGAVAVHWSPGEGLAALSAERARPPWLVNMVVIFAVMGNRRPRRSNKRS